MATDEGLGDIDVEWLILADYAQVIGGKLYMMGGGWTKMTLGKPLSEGHSHHQAVAIALAVTVPWHRANEQHGFEIDVQTDDGETISKLNGMFETGRPPGTPPGQDQRVQLAVTMNMEFKGLGAFVIIARIDGEEKRRIAFNVLGPQIPATT